MSRLTIKADPEFRRIDALPRRAWTPEQVAQLQAHYTHHLRNPYGTQTLKPVQALAIHEAATVGGVFGPIGCGEGKTIPSLVIPIAMSAQRPLLLVPANLLRKTVLELPEIGSHWKLPPHYPMRSYSELAIESRAGELDELAPDLIVCDEVHKLKNQSAAITRRVGKYLAANRHCRFVALSGTLLTDDLDDLVHLAAWSLRQGSPYPYSPETVAIWKSAMSGSMLSEADPGPIASWPYDGRVYDTTDQVRKAVRKRALDTAGVVASSNGESFAGTILVGQVRITVPEHVDRHFRRLREDWTTPDGWMLATPIELWSKARELALGFHYQWDPRPPRAWLSARGWYASLVRAWIETHPDQDSERQVRTMLEEGGGDEVLREAWQKWTALEPTFTVNQTIVWHDDTAIKACIAWAKRKPGIIWTSHRYFAEELQRRSGLPYYGNEAEDAQTGQHVLQHPANKSMICSVESCGTGQNLQAWNRNLWTAPRGKSPEQLLARTHRPGQLKDEVIFDVLVGCREHQEAIPRALSHARMIVATVPNATQKLLLADLDWPEEWPGTYAYESNRSKPVATGAELESLLDEIERESVPTKG